MYADGIYIYIPWYIYHVYIYTIYIPYIPDGIYTIYIYIYILLLYKVMAIIQTPQVGNQSAYPKILPLSNILMVLINHSLNNILRSTRERLTNIIRPTSGGGTERHTGDEKIFTTITPLGRACKATL